MLTLVFAKQELLLGLFYKGFNSKGTHTSNTDNSCHIKGLELV